MTNLIQIPPPSEGTWARIKRGVVLAFAAVLAFFVYGYKRRGAQVIQLKNEKELAVATTKVEVATATLNEEKKKYEDNYRTYEDIKRDNADVLRKYGVGDGSDPEKP